MQASLTTPGDVVFYYGERPKRTRNRAALMRIDLCALLQNAVDDDLRHRQDQQLHSKLTRTKIPYLLLADSPAPAFIGGPQTVVLLNSDEDVYIKTRMLGIEYLMNI